jgi:hypothetical protein
MRKKCPDCGCWNRFEVNKLFVEQETPEPKVKAYIPMYEPFKTETCKKCGQVIAQPKDFLSHYVESEHARELIKKIDQYACKGHEVEVPEYEAIFGYHLVISAIYHLLLLQK